MKKFIVCLLLLPILNSCYYDDWYPCQGYTGHYNPLKKPGFLDDLHEWTFVLKDSSAVTDTMKMDSFSLETFIISNRGECREECETHLLKGYGNRITLECMQIAEVTENDYYNRDDLFFIKLQVNNQIFIDSSTTKLETFRFKFRNDSGLMEVKRLPQTLLRIK